MIVHLVLLVSFFIVRQVVPQGKWNSAKMIVQIAVMYVQPFLISNNFNEVKSRDVNFDSFIYIIMAMGITISFAGNPRINASSMTPPRPNVFANGSKNKDICFITDKPFMLIFESIHISSPIGADMITARANIWSVLSNMERIITLPILGFLKGGISSMNDDGNPFNIVFDSIFDTIKVMIIDKIINPVNSNVEEMLDVAKKIVINVIIVGNFPLHGTKEFVNIAINLSLLVSIILEPTTPHELQPKPIHIVKDCFPCAHAFLNSLSILNAILGKKPESSNNVKRGKNIAIGGSITDTTQERVLYIPFTIASINKGGIYIIFKKLVRYGSIPNNRFERSCEG